MPKIEVTELLARVGFRSPSEKLRAFVEHAIRGKLGPVETIEGMVAGTGAVPEPSTWAMMGIGFLGLGVAGARASRRRRAPGAT